MVLDERKSQLMALLKKHKFMTVSALAKALYTSESTVRRDLNDLERLGLVKRAHGGAGLLRAVQREMPLELCMRSNIEGKRDIARQAAGMIGDQSILYIDASTSAMQLLPHIRAFKNVTLFTDGLATAQEAADAGIDAYCLGGRVNAARKHCYGPFTLSVLENIFVDIMFFSAPAVTAEGEVTHYSAEAVRMLQLLFTRARQRVLLCDSSKIGKASAYRICHVKELDRVLCDKPLPPSWEEKAGQ